MGFGVGLLHRRREAARGEDTGDGRSHAGPLPPRCLPPATPSPQSGPTSPSSCRRWGRWGGGRPAARRASPAPRPAAPSCTGRGGFTIHPLHSRSPPTAPGPGTASPRGFAFQCGRTAPTPARAAAKRKLRHGRSQPHLRIPGHPGDTSQHRRLAPPPCGMQPGGTRGAGGCSARPFPALARRRVAPFQPVLCLFPVVFPGSDAFLLNTARVRLCRGGSGSAASRGAGAGGSTAPSTVPEPAVPCSPDRIKRFSGKHPGRKQRFPGRHSWIYGPLRATPAIGHPKGVIPSGSPSHQGSAVVWGQIRAEGGGRGSDPPIVMEHTKPVQWESFSPFPFGSRR